MTQDQEQLTIDMRNEMAKLEQNLAKLEDSMKRLSFVLREVSYLIGVKNGTDDTGTTEPSPDNSTTGLKIIR